MRIFLIAWMLLIISLPSNAQVDPVLAGMIEEYSLKTEKTLKSQEKVMAMGTTGLLWVQEEVNGVTEFQRTYVEYLDSFRNIVAYAAQVYGLYSEVEKLVGNLSDLSSVIGNHAEGAVAAALLPNRSKIYREVVLESVSVVNDVRLVCFGNKLTEKERIEIVFGVRPKIKVLNQKIQRLMLCVKYSSFKQVWGNIEDGAKADKIAIGRKAYLRWKRAAR